MLELSEELFSMSFNYFMSYKFAELWLMTTDNG